MGILGDICGIFMDIWVFRVISVAICMDMWAIYEYFGQYLGRFTSICGRYVLTNEKMGDLSFS